jgi:hypothetical protein
MEQQTYATHRHRPTGWLLAGLAATVSFFVLAVNAFERPSAVDLALVLLAGSVVSVVLLLRRFALRLQDRIIRLEMQQRLGRLGLAPMSERLALPQLIALRFACDAELPGLLDRALAEGLTPDAIKKAITSWQGDHLRT